MDARYPDSCDRVLLDAAALSARVAELGAEIARDYRGKDLRLVTVLKGGLYFLADLSRRIDLPLSMDFMAVSPYAAGMGGAVRVTKDLTDDINGASVLLVEDVVDTGLTVNYVLSLLRAHNPGQLDVCALLDKPARRIAASVDSAPTPWSGVYTVLSARGACGATRAQTSLR